MNITYTSKVDRSWQRVGTSSTVCVTRELAKAAPITKNHGYTVGKSADLVPGDFVSAFPYDATIYENTPMLGSYVGTNRVFYPPSSLHYQACGSTAGSYREISGDAGYYFPVHQPIYPVDLETEQFVMDYSVTQALSDLRRSFVNIPLLYAERKQTIAMIHDNLKRMNQTVGQAQQRALKRYKQSGVWQRKAVARSIANEHLMILFGFLPLIGEIKGAIDLILSPDTMVITGRGKRAYDNDIEEELLHTPRDVDHALETRNEPSLRCNIIGRDRISARTSISVEISSRAMQGLRDLGFNPLAATFDIIPLSFLGNFISNVGAWISTFDPMPDAKLLRASTGLWREATRSYTVVPHPYFYPAGASYGLRTEGYSCDTTGEARTLHVRRFTFDAMPDPTLLMANNLSFAKAATATSLAIQRFVKPVQKLIRARTFRYKGPRPKYLPPIKWKP